MPVRIGAVPVCLICNNTVAVVKCCNLNRRYETMHKDFHKKWSFGSAACKDKLYAYLLSYKNSTTPSSNYEWARQINRSSIVCVLDVKNKHQKSFSDSETVRKCLLEVATALFEEKKNVINAVQKYSFISKKQYKENRNVG